MNKNRDVPQEIRELLTMTNGELRRLDLGRDELLAELEKFDYRAAALERMFRQDHGV